MAAEAYQTVRGTVTITYATDNLSAGWSFRSGAGVTTTGTVARNEGEPLDGFKQRVRVYLDKHVIYLADGVTLEDDLSLEDRVDALETDMVAASDLTEIEGDVSDLETALGLLDARVVDLETP